MLEVILVVDDEPAVLAIVCSVLSRAGFETLGANSAEAALRIAAERSGPIHLLLSDVVMPGLSGPKMAEAFARLHPEAQWLFMAGMPESPEILDLLDQGLAFMAKPFLPKELVDKVRGLLGHGERGARAPA